MPRFTCLGAILSGWTVEMLKAIFCSPLNTHNPSEVNTYCASLLFQEVRGAAQLDVRAEFGV